MLGVFYRDRAGRASAENFASRSTRSRPAAARNGAQRLALRATCTTSPVLAQLGCAPRAPALASRELYLQTERTMRR